RQLEKSMLDAGGKVLARHQRPLFELDTAVVEGHAVEERAAVELRGALPLAITKRVEQVAGVARRRRPGPRLVGDHDLSRPMAKSRQRHRQALHAVPTR